MAGRQKWNEVGRRRRELRPLLQSRLRPVMNLGLRTALRIFCSPCLRPSVNKDNFNTGLHSFLELVKRSRDVCVEEHAAKQDERTSAANAQVVDLAQIGEHLETAVKRQQRVDNFEVAKAINGGAGEDPAGLRSIDRVYSEEDLKSVCVSWPTCSRRCWGHSP